MEDALPGIPASAQGLVLPEDALGRDSVPPRSAWDIPQTALGARPQFCPPSFPSLRGRAAAAVSPAGPSGAEAHGDPLSLRVPERAGITYMTGRSWRALPGGQPAATQAQKRQSHSRQVTSAGRRGSAPAAAGAASGAPLRLASPRPAQKLGSRGRSCVRGSRGGGVCLAEVGAAAARPHCASIATRSAGGAAGPAPEAPWQLSCAPLLHRERLEPSEQRGPAAPAAPVPWKRARRAPALAPTERLKRQPLRHQGLSEPLAPPPPPTSSSLSPLHPAGGG